MKQNETLSQYLTYVNEQLATVDQSLAVVSYNTGYGLSIVHQDLGPECHCMDVLSARVANIRPPRIDDDDAWMEAWVAACWIVREFCKKRT